MHTTSVSSSSNNLLAKAEQLMHTHKLEDIKAELLKDNLLLEEEANTVVKHLKQLQHDKDHKMGRLLILMGAVLLLTGFVVTFLNIFANQSVHFALYGLTSLGLLIMFVGLYYIFN